MLLELSIDDLALFEHASLAFGPGLNVISGETGAGKSLLIGALELLLGERPKSSLVRQGAKEARVEGRFALAAESLRDSELAHWFASALPAIHEEWSELAHDAERELILGRTLSSEGRSRAWINHRPVTQKVLRELAALLVEIHGQNEHQRLFEASEQTRLLDAFGDLGALLDAYRTRRAAWIELARKLESHEADARERSDRIDLLRFQSGELADAKLSVEEHEALVRERELLRHASELGAQLGAIANDLADRDDAPVDALRRAQRVLEHWSAKLAALAPAASAMQTAALQLEESLALVTQFLEGLDYSPDRLETVEARLYQIEQLARKYRGDVAALVERARAIRAELDALESHAETRSDLARACGDARAELESAALRLSKARHALCARLKKAVLGNLRALGLERADFDVRIETRAEQSDADQRRFAHDGIDHVEFYLAANPGLAAQPLRAVASGGETARIMLALRTALAVRQTIPTLVFDEVDAGVGGRLGPKVGEHLRALAAHHQILCVTHLPAIAALAHQHFKVEKRTSAGRTRTEVALLAGDSRVEEIADMIAGGAAHATARAEARRLLAHG